MVQPGQEGRVLAEQGSLSQMPEGNACFKEEQACRPSCTVTPRIPPYLSASALAIGYG